MEKANENLAAAQLCFDHGYFNACANRVYYAMFQAGAAALFKHGMVPSKEQIGHAWFQSNVAGQLINRRKIFSAKFRSHLSDAYRVRPLADYPCWSISKQVAVSELKKSQRISKRHQLGGNR
ncbi:MAG: HEPN domain-containing protein [candidate division KSB1 bacterium]|nr:HEPN domain-containing protein [candidate division KSB1 bacterium]